MRRVDHAMRQRVWCACGWEGGSRVEFEEHLAATCWLCGLPAEPDGTTTRVRVGASLREQHDVCRESAS